MDVAESFGIEDFVNDAEPLEVEKFERAKKAWLEFWEWVEAN